MPIGPILRAGEDQWSIWSARPPPAHLPHTSRTPPGHLPDVISEAQPRAAGLPKRLKNAFVAQKVVSGSVSGDNSCRLWGYHRFGLIFWSKNTVFFIIFASLFLHQKTQIMKQTWWFQLGSKPWKLLFFLGKTMIFKESRFCVFINFHSASLRKVVKEMVWHQSVMTFFKMHRNVRPWDLFWVQKWLGIDQDRPKNPKNSEKQQFFWPCHFFSKFWSRDMFTFCATVRQVCKNVRHNSSRMVTPCSQLEGKIAAPMGW